MEVDETELNLEKVELTGKSPQSVSDKMNEWGNNQANQYDTSSPIALTKSSTQESHSSSDIKVTLENESVWSRFHSLGTEMILTKQGRRMFPCCRFSLSGLDLQRKYFLVMDIMPLDDFTYRFNGNTWERVAVDEPHVLRQICVHPESPALGQQWMESPVSFYKVKLTNGSIDQDGCVLLRPMHRYLPRLHIVPVDPDSEKPITVHSPNIKTFSFPQTEFYAVTGYQNPQITQLKIDCNPFAMVFRKDNQSINPLKDKLRLCSSVGTHLQSPLLSLAWKLGGKRRQGAVKSTASTGIPDTRMCGPNSASHKEKEEICFKKRNDTLGCPNNIASCQESTDYSKNDAVVNKCPAETEPDEYLAPLDFESIIAVSLEEILPSTGEPVPPMSSSKNPNTSEDAVDSQISCTNSESPTNSSTAAQSPQAHWEPKSADLSLSRPPFLNRRQAHKHKPGPMLRCRRNRRGRKAKSKRWSNVKNAKPPAQVMPHNVPVQPDLEDVDGMLFVSFVAKEALNTSDENIKESESSLPPLSLTLHQSDNHEPESVSFSLAERIAKFEKMLLLQLKQQKHRQVIHPCLQDVGMKLGLLDPTLPIDLQYLGVHLPLSTSIHEGLDEMDPMSLSSSPDSAGCFVSRTGKTNDPTKIKGWREKFKTNIVQSTSEGPKDSSAFCSEMLDAYLENEAEQISDRVAVFSKCSSPVSYQLPSKSSSYVVTLDSLLKTRSLSSNKGCSKPTDQGSSKYSLRGSPSTDVSLSLEGCQTRLKTKREKGREFAHSFQAHQRTAPIGQASRSMSFDSRPRLKKQPGKSQLKMDSIVETASHGCSVSSPTIPVIREKKVENKTLLQEMEEEVFCQGKVRTHITTERAIAALKALINFKIPRKRSAVRKDKDHHKNENACSEDFCRLGCLCDSLERKIRGPTHCRRVECMFDCSCFKHKVLVLQPTSKTVANDQQDRKRSVMAFPIADPEKETRPPPAPNITTLWKRKAGEHDPEPLFQPASSIFRKSRSCPTDPSSQVQEEDKDPVYLYFESKMTCARVREYNSNPPPQIHMFPNKKQKTVPEQLNETAKAAEPPSSEKVPETNPTDTLIKTDEPKPTKLLEILSECNWEPHRSSVLSTLFRRMNSNLLSEPFCFGMYKIQLLSTTVKGVDRSSTIIYKVCISHADEKEMTSDLEPPLKKARKSLKGFENKEKLPQKADHKSGRKSSSLVEKQQKKPLSDNECGRKSSSLEEKQQKKPLSDNDCGRNSSSLEEKQQKKPLCNRLIGPLSFPTNAAPAGYLRADIKKPEDHPTQVLIQVNGKTYNQAKFLLGQLGALHSVNRFAAFVTGRLLPDQPKNEDITKTCPFNASLRPSSVIEVANVLNQTSPNLAVARPSLANVPEPNTTYKNTRTKTGRLNATFKASLKRSSVKELANVSNRTSSNLAAARPPLANVPEPDTTSKNTRTTTGPLNTTSKSAGQQPGLTPIVPDGTRFVLVPVRPSNFAAAPSSSLPPGQQVILKPAPGGQGSNFVCQYNGKLLELKPISPAPVVHLQPSSVSQGSTLQVVQTASNTCLPQDTKSLQKPLNSTPLSNVLPNPLPVIAPNVFSLSATSGIHIANGMPAFNVQSGFSGKAGTFSFRICPPNNVGKPIGSAEVCKPREHSSSTLMLPGGFTLIKLLHSAVPAVSANVTSVASHPAESPKNDESVKDSVQQSPSTSPEQTCQGSVSNTNPLPPPEPSNCISAQASEALNKSSSCIPSEDLYEDEPVEQFSQSVNTGTQDSKDWVPYGAEMVLQDDVSEWEPDDMDDWPPNGAERILWIDSEEENEDLDKELNNSLDVAAESPAADKVSELKNTTKTVKAILNSSDECLHVGTETPKSHNIHENDLPPKDDVCSKSSHVEQKQMMSTKPNNNKENVFDSYVSAENLKTGNVSKEEPLVIINKVDSNKQLQTTTETREQVAIQENTLPVLNKNEPYNDPTEKYLETNDPESNIKIQGVLSQNNDLHISAIETCNRQKGENTHFDSFVVSGQRLGSANIYSSSCKTDTCSVHDGDAKQHISSDNILPLISKEEPSMNQTVAEFPKDLSVQGLASENCLKNLKQKEFYNNPEDGHKDTDIAPNAVCSLLDGQTPMKLSTFTAASSKENGKRNVSPLLHNVHKSSTGLSDGFHKLSDSCPAVTKTDKQDLKEEKREAEDRNKLLKSKTAVEELSDSNDIIVDVVNLSEDEAEDQVAVVRRRFGNDIDNSSNDSEEDSNSDEEDWSNDYTSDSETSDDTGDTSIEYYTVRKRNARNAKRAASWKKNKYLSTEHPVDVLEKRLIHTENERVRRDEMRQYFYALKKALNIEERVSMCKLDILNQARLMIWALKDRSQCLEEKKKALLQRQSFYLNKILELSEKPEVKVNASFKKNCEQQQQQLGSQNTLQSSGPGQAVNTQRVDNDGNRLPPCLGSWNPPNYICKRSNKTLYQPSITDTENLSLPKIVLQSFSKTDAVKLTHDVRASLPSSTQVSNSAELLNAGDLELKDHNEKNEKSDAIRVCPNVIEKTLLSEHSNKGSPSSSSPVTESDVQKKSLSEVKKDEQTSAAMVKGRKKKVKYDVVIEEALSNPDVLGARQLRQRSPAVNGGATRGRSTNKRKRII
ncbi:MAX gene-associated protein isoform X1 [Clarias gariepinus]|uniref:MAX gene-associated protein isoform X1 n=1 Tax=Clarias gariepinus TaxID=13013 RepID=UPI00234CC4D2|nr:MAX gene-associated protein isoform X1 [Clarias gariepinus]